MQQIAWKGRVLPRWELEEMTVANEQAVEGYCKETEEKILLGGGE